MSPGEHPQAPAGPRLGLLAPWAALLASGQLDRSLLLWPAVACSPWAASRGFPACGPGWSDPVQPDLPPPLAVALCEDTRLLWRQRTKLTGFGSTETPDWHQKRVHRPGLRTGRPLLGQCLGPPAPVRALRGCARRALARQPWRARARGLSRLPLRPAGADWTAGGIGRLVALGR